MKPLWEYMNGYVRTGEYEFNTFSNSKRIPVSLYCDHDRKLRLPLVFHLDDGKYFYRGTVLEDTELITEELEESGIYPSRFDIGSIQLQDMLRFPIWNPHDNISASFEVLRSSTKNAYLLFRRSKDSFSVTLESMKFPLGFEIDFKKPWSPKILKYRDSHYVKAYELPRVLFEELVAWQG